VKYPNSHPLTQVAKVFQLFDAVIKPVGQFYKNITIVNYTSRVVRMTSKHGASITIVILATLEVSFKLLELSIMLLETFIVQASLMMIVIYDHHIFIVQATMTSH
jgi:hypothetical protein